MMNNDLREIAKKLKDEEKRCWQKGECAKCKFKSMIDCKKLMFAEYVIRERQCAIKCFVCELKQKFINDIDVREKLDMYEKEMCENE